MSLETQKENKPHIVGIPKHNKTTSKVEYAWFGEVSHDNGVVLEIERLLAEKKRYYTGDAIYDHKEKGLNVSLKFSLDDFSIAGLQRANKWLDSGVVDKLYFRAKLGGSLRAKGFPVVLRPFDAEDDSEDKVLYLCNNKNNITMDFNADGDKPIDIEYQAYPIFTVIDEEKKDENGEVVLDELSQPVMVKQRYIDYGCYGKWEAEFLANEGYFFTVDQTFDGVAY
jgi:hypothetical protein